MAIKYTVFTHTYKCPHCGAEYDYTAHSTGFLGNSSHNFRYYLDNPIIKCKSCGQEFIDTRKKEFITMNNFERNAYFLNYNSKGPTVWIIIFLVYGIGGFIGAIATQTWALFIMTGVALILMLIPLKVKNDRNKRIENRIFDDEITKSLTRCKQKEHLRRLVLCGCKLYPLTEVELSNNPGYKVINDLINDVISENLECQLEKQE